MGVLSVLNSVKSSTIIGVSVLLASFLWLGSQAESTNTQNTNNQAGPGSRIDVEQLPFCDDDFVDKSQGSRRRYFIIKTY